MDVDGGIVGHVRVGCKREWRIEYGTVYLVDELELDYLFNRKTNNPIRIQSQPLRPNDLTTKKQKIVDSI